MAKKRRSRQVTCVCHAYRFPHRIGGGRCTGAVWAASYLEIVRTECETCVAFGIQSCAVADGRESYLECQGYHEYLLRGNPKHLPQTLEGYIDGLSYRYEEEYFDE